MQRFGIAVGSVFLIERLQAEIVERTAAGPAPQRVLAQPSASEGSNG
jgi:hypothetical protein